MATLCVPLQGPMQSWADSSRFTDRDTGSHPTKSGVIGIFASAMGIERGDRDGLASLAKLKMATRHDRPGFVLTDYQTVGGGIRADGGFEDAATITLRHYLSDAAFMVGMESDDRGLLERIHEALWDPKYFVYLGRKSYVPSRSLYMDDAIKDAPLMEAIMQPELMVIGPKPRRVLVSFESQSNGRLQMDQPISSFSNREFAARYIQSRWVEL